MVCYSISGGVVVGIPLCEKRRLARMMPCVLPIAFLVVASAQAGDRAAWMPSAKWGVMNHYLADWIARTTRQPMTVERWNSLVDRFDVEALAEQLKSVGASYYQISIGQNSGYYLSPNATYDRITGIKPGKCSRRDLVADLYEALHKRGIRLMVYLPTGAPGGDAAARQALQWDIREWSTRWGAKVSGWCRLGPARRVTKRFEGSSEACFPINAAPRLRPKRIASRWQIVAGAYP